MNNSIDGIDFSRYSSSTYPNSSLNGTVDVWSDGIDFSKYSSSTIYPDSSVNGTVGTWTGKSVQIIETNPDDVILCEVSNDIDLEDCEAIHKELTKAFPKNTILLINGNIIKNFTFLRPKEDIISSIETNRIGER
jgi:hypothetical protein